MSRKKLKEILKSWENESLPSITKSKKNLPAILSSLISITAGATIIYSDLDKNYLLTSAKAEGVTTLVYNLTHPILFGIINAKRYSGNGFKNGTLSMFYDMIFKLAPSGGLSSALITHLGRPSIQTLAMNFGISPVPAYLGIAGTLDGITLYARNKLLEGGSYVRTKINQYVKQTPKEPKKTLKKLEQTF